MNILHGDVNQTEPIKVGDSGHVTCHHGYQLSEADKNDLKCVEGGKYDLSIPSCIGKRPEEKIRCVLMIIDDN